MVPNFDLMGRNIKILTHWHMKVGMKKLLRNDSLAQLVLTYLLHFK